MAIIAEALFGAADVAAIERATVSRVAGRILPLLVLCYLMASLDRTNVGYAALTMNKALGFSSGVYAFGAGVFFLGYFAFEIPSNLILARVGARRWIARIMITWSMISALTAAVTGPHSFYAARLLLGLAEAGFFPGVILYLSWWVPSYYRSRMIGMFMAAAPIANILGGLIAGPILALDGRLGLQGWQWLFVLEALPAAVLGVVVLFYLPDRPEQARWLSDAQRSWLVGRLDGERRQRETIRKFDLGSALASPRLWAFTLIYFGMSAAGYGLSLFMPLIIQGLGVSNAHTGQLAAVPPFCGLIAMFLWTRHSDRTGERPMHLAISCLTAAFGLMIGIMFHVPVAMLVALIVAQIGIVSYTPVFWTMPTAALTGTAAAGGIAFINSVGNLSSFLGPFGVGLIRDATGSFTLGLLLIAMGPLVAGLTALALGHDRRLERPSAEPAPAHPLPLSGGN